MRVNYTFIFTLGENPKRYRFNTELRISGDFNAQDMLDVFNAQARSMGVPSPRLLACFHTYGNTKFPNFCYTNIPECVAVGCNRCPFKNLANSIPITKYEPIKGQSVYNYVWEVRYFTEEGVGLIRTMRFKMRGTETPKLQDVLVYFDNLDKASPDYDGREKHVIGVNLQATEETGEFTTTQNADQFYPDQPYELFWVRVNDMSQKNPKAETWIPGFKQNGKMWSVLGELEDPDSEEDTRPFNDCPFPNYKVTQ